jgi:hypothetical protein
VPARRILSRLVASLAFAIAVASPVIARAQSADRAFSLFLDCRDLYCEPAFYRTEIAFVDHVRDRTAADVHLLITRQPTGGGGAEYTLAFYGQRSFEGVSDTIALAMPQGSTEDERRRTLVRTIRLGLARYLARTPDGARCADHLSLGRVDEGRALYTRSVERMGLSGRHGNADGARKQLVVDRARSRSPGRPCDGAMEDAVSPG